MSRRDDYQKHMQEELELWTARLDALASKSKDAIQGQIEEWRASSEVAKAKLVELRATTSDAWDVIKADLEKLWGDLRSVLDHKGAGDTLPEAPPPVVAAGESTPPPATPPPTTPTT